MPPKIAINLSLANLTISFSYFSNNWHSFSPFQFSISPSLTFKNDNIPIHLPIIFRKQLLEKGEFNSPLILEFFPKKDSTLSASFRTSRAPLIKLVWVHPLAFLPHFVMYVGTCRSSAGTHMTDDVTPLHLLSDFDQVPLVVSIGC